MVLAEYEEIDEQPLKTFSNNNERIKDEINLQNNHSRNNFYYS